MDSKETRAQREHQQREKGLDKTLEDSFPSSDPPSTIPDPLLETPDARSDSSSSASEHETNRAFKDTLQTYMDQVGIKLDLRHIESTIRQSPLAMAAIATAAGFIVGGGLGTRSGSRMLGLLSRRTVGRTARNF
jgi:hypothetical protein